MALPKRYVPKHLSKRDKSRQKKMIRRSKRLYKKGKYYSRKKVKSFKSKESPHVKRAKKIYNISSISASSNLAKKTGCSISALRKIVNKGRGAYFSSGSRPNQTSHSWGRARLASSISAGKAAAVDYKILLSGCNKTSKALRLARSAKRKYGKGSRRIPKIKGGKREKMREKILLFKRGPYPKKYSVVVKNKKTHKERTLNFGDRRYQQYKDRTPIKLYSKRNHGDKQRQANYYNRHSGVKNRKKAIEKEIRKSHGYYTPKILSHEYLW